MFPIWPPLIGAIVHQQGAIWPVFFAGRVAYRDPLIADANCGGRSDARRHFSDTSTVMRPLARTAEAIYEVVASDRPTPLGHVSGAFTGAVHDHLGSFLTAEGGTLFLDDIDEVPPAMQVKLLQVINERTVMRLLGLRVYGVQFRPRWTWTHLVVPNPRRNDERTLGGLDGTLVDPATSTRG